jgi:sec-independent protein translocase protein TatB
MFDIGAGELLVLGIVALIVIGPKELPTLLRTVGKATNKMRRMAGEFRSQFDEAMREAEVAEAKKQFDDLSKAATAATSGFNPIDTIRSEFSTLKDEIRSNINGTSNTVIAPPAPDPVPAPVVSPSGTSMQSSTTTTTDAAGTSSAPMVAEPPPAVQSTLAEVPAIDAAVQQALIEQDRFEPKAKRKAANGEGKPA